MIFRAGDANDSGALSWEEFKEHLGDERVSVYLSTLDLEFSELQTLYKILDVKGMNAVAIDDFVWGCIRLKGEAKSMDLCTLLYEHRQHNRLVDDSLVRSEQLLQGIAKGMGLTLT